MTREDVMENLEAFLALLQREQEIKEELLSLKMYGHRATEDDVADKLGRHDGLLAEIERLRNEEMLPILESLAQFIQTSRVQSVA